MATLRALNLRFSARARSQLASIQAYIHRRNPAAAARVGAAIRDAAERLRYFPLAGRTEIEADEVMILGVFHGAQDRPQDERIR